MKMLMILLSSLILTSTAFAASDRKEDAETEATPQAPDSPSIYKGLLTDDAATEGISVNREVGCKSGLCPNPILNKQATLTDQQNAKNIVDWIMNNGSGTPPALSNTEGKK